MAFGRRPYTTKFRPWVDSDQQVELVWYPAAPDASVLGYPSKIVQLDNVSSPWLAEGVGEVYGAARSFNHRGVIPFQKFGHVCGTLADFEVGGTRDTVPPDVVYDRNNIPICCGPPFIGQGGGVGSGTAATSFTPGVVRYHVHFTDGGTPVDLIYIPYPGPPGVWYVPAIFPQPTLFAPGGVFPTDWGLSPGNACSHPSMFWTYPSSWDGTGTQTFTTKHSYLPPPVVSDATVTRI